MNRPEEAFGSLSYNGMIVKAEKRFSKKGLTFLLSYTWSHAIDNLDEVGNGESAGALKPWDRNLNRASALTDIRQSFVYSSTYESAVWERQAVPGQREPRR